MTDPVAGFRSRRAPLLVVLATALALLAAIVVVVVVVSGGDESADEGTRPTTPGASGPTGTTAPSTTSPTPAADAIALWPFPGSATRYATPEAAAGSFASEFLRFDAPTIGAFQAGDARSGEVPVRPSESGPVTTVLVRQVGPDDGWSVLGAATENIEVTTPALFAAVTSPVHVAGRALAFEGHVQVEVRADGNLGAIGEGFVTGGGDLMRPFEGSIAFETPGAPRGALVFFTGSAENGQVWEAEVVRVSFVSTDIDAAACDGYRSPQPRPSAGQMVVKVYFSCDAADGALRAVYRLAPESSAVLRTALDALVAGPTPAEREASLSSWFSDDTEGVVAAVSVIDGHAVVDFGDLRRLIPGAGSGAGSLRLLSQLDATVFQFPSVDSLEYRIEGSCEAFNEWLQLGGCEPRGRGTATD